LKAKEKQFAKRETSLNIMEQDISEQGHQVAAFKSLVVQLETKVKNIEEENRLLKIQLLASSSVHTENPQKQPQPPPQPPPMHHMYDCLAATTNSHILDTLINNKFPSTSHIFCLSAEKVETWCYMEW
jgi:small-conductance mechanosensitive channel